MENNKRVIILSGPSGVGKSTYIKSFLDPLVPHKIASADDFFSLGRLDYKFDPMKLGEAHAYCFRVFIEAVQAKVDCVYVDNTNTSVTEIAPYVLGAEAYGYTPSIVTLRPRQTHIHDIAARNTHGVPLAGVVAQDRRINDRVLPPWWKHTFIYV